VADTPKGINLSPELHRYLLAHGTPPDPVQQALIAETEALGGISQMQIAPEQGTFMTILTQAIGARYAVEVGTFTGYSSIAIARGLPDDGTLVCCDVSEEWTAIARHHWEAAGVAHKIDLRIGPAAETLQQLDLTWDLAFIDADKPGYPTYYEAILAAMRPGGLILVDNVLWGGSVAQDLPDDDTNGRAIQAFNDQLAADDRVDVVMLPISDGLTIARKR
jgi:caffeoyl-CoA O-methyltransferase